MFGEFGSPSLVAGCVFGWLSNFVYFGGTILSPAKPQESSSFPSLPSGVSTLRVITYLL